MERRDIENGIARSWQSLSKLTLEETFSNPAPLPVDVEFRDAVLDDALTYSQIYMAGLSRSVYNILLRDFSFFQFSLGDGGGVRYGYYPNPFVSTQGGVAAFRRKQELVEAGLITVEEHAALLRESSPDGRAPLVRYENAPSQWRSLAHPCSHFHIGHHGDNRWALRRVLTPLAFTLIIAKQYYGEQWRLEGDDEADENHNSFETALIAERQNCRIIGDEHFDDAEGRSFHFA